MPSDLQALFERQRAHAPVMARTSAAERRARLAGLRRAIVARRAEIGAAVHADLRRPPAETEIAELHGVLAEIGVAIRRLPRWMRGTRAPTPLLLFGTSSRITYEPRGVVLVVAPWNYPFSLVVNPLIAAIAAGNCVILKPSEKTPATAALLARLIAETFDPAEVAVVQGGPDVATALLGLPFDHICFTGSTAIGRIVMAAAAKHLASVTLELGGKSPAVVDASADIAVAAERIVWGKFLNAGQTCIAPDYVHVHASRAREFLDAAKAALARLYGGSEEEREASLDFARIVDDGHVRRLKDLVDRTVAAGAEVETGGRIDAATRYVAPTILSNVAPDAAIMADEIFGPVLPVLAFDTLDEVLAVIRAGGKPLAMYIFARENAAIDRLLRETSAGATVVNNTMLHYASSALPFGGVGASGMGSYHGDHGFREFSHARPVTRQREPALIGFFFPPYRGRWHRLAMRVLRLLE